MSAYSIILLCAVVVMVITLSAPGVKRLIDWARGKKEGKLIIHSAAYGTGDNFRDVTSILKKSPRDGLVLEVENNSFGFDPAPMKPKQIRVKYSYGNQASRDINRSEGSILVLPEDAEIVRLKSEVETLRNPRMDDSQPHIGTLRILEGYFAAVVKDQTKVMIVLSVKVDGIISEISDCNLKLVREGMIWKMGYWQRLPSTTPIEPISIVKYNKQEGVNAFNVGPSMPLHVPDRGWMVFTTDKEFEIQDHLFGAAFVITAQMVDGKYLEATRDPGGWLHKAHGISVTSVPWLEASGFSLGETL